MIQPPSAQSHTDSILWALPFCQMEWDLTPPAVQDYIKYQNQQIAQFQTQIDQLQQQVETLQGRVEKTSQTSSKPPSSDSPFNKPTRQKRTASGTRGGPKGHRGKGPTFLSPPEVHLIEPGPCACGHGHLVSLRPSHTHQVIELPPIEMDIHHFVRQQGPCQGCGRHLTAQGPPEHQSWLWPALDRPDRCTRRHPSHLMAARARLLSLRLAHPDQPGRGAQRHQPGLARHRAPL
jgi:transposase